jgi:catechol 2,3-dioxygenase-like lactoylglutathione lyase family enzyme
MGRPAGLIAVAVAEAIALGAIIAATTGIAGGADAKAATGAAQTGAPTAEAGTPAAIPLTGFSHINIKSSDIKRSAQFYTAVLGFHIHKMLKQTAAGVAPATSLEEPGVHWVFMDGGPIKIVLVATPGLTPASDPPLVPSFLVKDLDAAFKAAEGLGLKIVKPIQRTGSAKDFGFFLVADPDGNPLDLIQLSPASKSVFDEVSAPKKPAPK